MHSIELFHKQNKIITPTSRPNYHESLCNSLMCRIPLHVALFSTT